jgi:hypothetical protein
MITRNKKINIFQQQFQPRGSKTCFFAVTQEESKKTTKAELLLGLRGGLRTS